MRPTFRLALPIALQAPNISAMSQSITHAAGGEVRYKMFSDDCSYRRLDES